MKDKEKQQIKASLSQSADGWHCGSIKVLASEALGLIQAQEREIIELKEELERHTLESIERDSLK